MLLGAVCIFPASSAPMLHYEAEGNFSYLGDDTTKTAAIYVYLNKKATDVTIPETIDGYTVTEICDDAFRDLENLKKVTLPDTVTKIGNHAFLQTPLKFLLLNILNHMALILLLLLFEISTQRPQRGNEEGGSQTKFPKT